MRLIKFVWCMLTVLLLGYSPGAHSAEEMQTLALTAETLDEPTAQQLAQFVREALAAALEKRPPNDDAFAGTPLARARNGAHLILLDPNGEVLSQAWSRRALLMVNLRLAAGKTIENQAPEKIRDAAFLLTVLQSPELPKRQHAVQLHPPIGVVGFLAEYDGREAFVPPLAPYLARQTWKEILPQLLGQIAPAGTRSDRLLRMTLKPGFSLHYVPGITIASRGPDTRPEVLYRLGHLVSPQAIDRKAIAEALVRAHAWYLAHQRPDGSFPFLYDPYDDTIRQRDNLEVTAINCAALGRLWRATDNGKARALGLKALQRLFARHYYDHPDGGAGYLREQKNDEYKVTLGASATGLIAILELAAHEKEPTFRARAEKLAGFLQAMRHPDGRYRSIYYPPGREEDRDDADRYTGQAQLALMLWAEATNNPGLVEDLFGSAVYFDNTRFRPSLRNPAKVPYRAMPWQTLASVRIYRVKKRQETSEFVFAMNDLLVSTLQDRFTDGDALLPLDARGRFLTPTARTADRPPYAAETGMYLQGALSAYRLARDTADPLDPAQQERLRKLRQASLWGLRYLLQLQIRDSYDTFAFARPERALGGFRTAMADPRIRLDNMFFAVSALSQALEALESEDLRLAQRQAGSH